MLRETYVGFNIHEHYNNYNNESSQDSNLIFLELSAVSLCGLLFSRENVSSRVSTHRWTHWTVIGQPLTLVHVA